MKSIYNGYLFILLLFFSNVSSQVSVYTFTQFAGTYSAITGGTVFGNAVTDDEVFVNVLNPLGNGIGATGPGMPIGFNFLFNNQVVNRVGINANAFLMFGPSLPFPPIETQCSNAFTPISATSTVLPIHQSKICAFGCDIQGQAGSEIRMQTIGVSPNQTLVVQWTNYRKYNHTGDNFNFQIRVCETTNVIEVIYGNCTNNNVAATCQVGLRGNTQTDFNNRFVNALNIWPASAAGNVNTSPCNFNNSLVPTNGLVYRWTPPPPCSGTPPANSAIATPPNICPGGTSTLNLGTTYSLTGLTYSWQASTTGSLGPYTAIPNGTNALITPSNINVSTWYNCLVTCSNGGGSITTSPFQVQTTAVIINNIPYYESFENIIVNNQFPNCSWAASNPTNVCQTYVTANTLGRYARTGNKYASFRFSTNPFGDYFYTNGLQLYAGITYSFSVWYVTDYLGSTGWSNFSVLLGPNQSTVGLTAISSLTGVVSTPVYNSLSNTFTVPTSGVYYMAVKAIGSINTNYLSWDDLEITIPCQLNAPAVNLSASSPSICSGQTLTLSVTGANTYTWSNGAPGNSIIVSPPIPTTYTVTGTNTLSSCESSSTVQINVSQTLAIGAFATPTTLCAGKQGYIYALGAPSYTWSNGSNSNAIAVSPSVTTIYTLQASNIDNCISQTTIALNVSPVPVLTVTALPLLLCQGESLTLTCTGAANYSWTSTNLFLISNPVILKPSAGAGYTVYGKDANGCENTAIAQVTVNLCLDVKDEKDKSTGVTIFPNPTRQNITIEVKENTMYSVLLYDVSGKSLIEETFNSSGQHQLSMETLPTGLYILRVTSNDSTVYFRLLKN